jgi:hypothetical protein
MLYQSQSNENGSSTSSGIPHVTPPPPSGFQAVEPNTVDWQYITGSP